MLWAWLVVIQTYFCPDVFLLCKKYVQYRNGTWLPTTTSSPSASMEADTLSVRWWSFLAKSSGRTRALSLLPQGKGLLQSSTNQTQVSSQLSLLLQPFPPSPQNVNHSQALLLAALASLPVYPCSWRSASPCLACDLHCASHFRCHQGQQWKSSREGQSLPSPLVKCQF